MAAATAKVPFTESQWEELERQTTIYKYMLASTPVPPHLLIPISKTPSPLPPAAASQSNMTGLDMRFSRNSDPEPWRCRRTDGKKWRCSRDVAPNQKYCERHAHKSRPRSRKPVESPSSHTHNTNPSSNTTNITNNNLNTHPLVNLPAQASFQMPTMVSGATYAQPRCTEWLMKGDSIPGSVLNQQMQWQRLMQSSSSSREGLKRCKEEHNRNESFFQQPYGEQQESMNTNSYFGLDCGQGLHNQQTNNDQGCSFRGPKIACVQGGLNSDQTQRTRRFIDAWSSADQREEMNEFTNKYSVSSSGKLPLSSLTLSMSGDKGIQNETANAQLGLGMMDNLACESGGGGLKPQWLDPVSWMGSSPGGPLGEALCLGIASTAKEAMNVPSPHGCYSNSTTTSSCSKSSCEDAGHMLHFH